MTKEIQMTNDEIRMRNSLALALGRNSDFGFRHSSFVICHSIAGGLTVSTTRHANLLRRLRLKDANPGAFGGEWFGGGKLLNSVSPINGQILASVHTALPAECNLVISRAQA